ncbi:MAG: peptidoglycan-associated lipoprotein Pal [Vicinamibacterales bacterium]
MSMISLFNRRIAAGGVLAAVLVMAACGKKPPAVPEPQPAPPVVTVPSTVPPPPSRPPQQAREPLPVPAQPVPEDGVSARSLDDLNRKSPLAPVFFGYDSSELSEAAQQTAQANAAVLRTNRSWVITIEGHSDERGTAEYNLALGERRASSVRAYLVSMGIAAERLRVVSYGKEFPFDPGHDEAAWTKNRRGHFVVTAK